MEKCRIAQLEFTNAFVKSSIALPGTNLFLGLQLIAQPNYSKCVLLKTKLKLLVENLHQERFDSILESQVLVQVHEVWCQFLEHLSHTNGDLFAFWMSYIQLVGDVILGLIRASQEGSWQLRLFAIRQIIPWCFAYDKMNYARYLSAYYAQMTTLEVDHPEVYQSFLEGRFSVQLAGDNPFGRLPVDQTTEVTVSKDTKTAGGVTNFSLKTQVVNRFYLTAEFRSAFL